MITPEEIQSIQLFATLGREACERIARVAADISLEPGEYAAREGDERALFAVLEGHVDVDQVARRDRDARRRAVPGAALSARSRSPSGSLFPVGFRAAERSRVMRIEAADYHAIAALSSDDQRRGR